MEVREEERPKRLGHANRKRREKKIHGTLLFFFAIHLFPSHVLLYFTSLPAQLYPFHSIPRRVRLKHVSAAVVLAAFPGNGGLHAEAARVPRVLFVGHLEYMGVNMN
jgi:hypothetical protein